MKLVYIASPYSKGDVAANVARQLSAAHELLDMGAAPIAPLLSHYLHLYRSRPYADWLNMDLAIVPRVDAVLRLDGESEGADKEVECARKHNIPVMYSFAQVQVWLLDLSDATVEVRSAEPPTAKLSILYEADQLVKGDRRNAYGHPYDDYTRTGCLMAPLLQSWAKVQAESEVPVPVPPEIACRLMLAVKLSRECNRHSRDNLTDLAGYARCLELIAERRAELVEGKVLDELDNGGACSHA